MDIYKNDHFTLSSEKDQLYITVFHAGFDIKKAEAILLDEPTLRINDLLYLEEILTEVSEVPLLIGSIRPRVEVFISNDELEASIRLNITAKEFSEEKIKIASEIIDALNAAKVTIGLDKIFTKPITVQKEMSVAKGTPAQNGKNAYIVYYKLTNRKPTIKEDGSVNHYNLKLIDNVKAGDWLGEKIPLTKGVPGISVTGKTLPAKDGRDFKLNYDRKTVKEYQEDNKHVLRAAINGAVKIEHGKISVDNLLIIPGDVGYATGNIEFDGFVEIGGTISDGFSVISKQDISINSNMGIGAVDKVISKEGSIYIKGGIFGKSIARIEAKKNVYVKYCNTCCITAGDEINIGFYALDCNLTARKVHLDPLYGRVIGGNITAEAQVTSGTIGNQFEKKTVINIQGFDRAAVKKEFEALLEKYKVLLSQANTIREQLDVLEHLMNKDSSVSITAYDRVYAQYEIILTEMTQLDEYRRKLQGVLEIKGEGEIDVIKAAYPETYFAIKNMHRRISSIESGSFYAVDNSLHHND